MENNFENSINFFMEYLKKVKNASENTIQSYKRDLLMMAKYFDEQGVYDIRRINDTNINSYILNMERNGKSGSTISRNMSTIKTFFRCMINNGMIKKEPTENLRTPDVESKKTVAISAEDMIKIINQIDDKEHKGLRDRAMFSLMLDAGIKVSEVIDIKLSDVNLKYSYVTCRCRKKDKTVRFGDDTLAILEKYINCAREWFIKIDNTEELFLNCFGKKMSRQGFWKIFKEYAKRAGVEGVSTRALYK